MFTDSILTTALSLMAVRHDRGSCLRVRHILQMTVMAALLAFVCVLCVQLDQPLTGMLKVEPEAFISVTHEPCGIP